jgi:AmiR/NasT family two-component response regulator
VLAERRRISVDEAFGLLRNHARRHNLHLSDVARDVATGSATADKLLHAPDRQG